MDDRYLELDIVIFELPTFPDLEAFCERFRPQWSGWSHADDEVWLFTADLDSGGDIASLFREAQGLLSELGVAAIRYWLDGRVYVLEAAHRPDSEASPAIAA
jgi:hypothetical protein